MLLTYFLNDFEMVPVAPISTGITFVFTFIYILLLLTYFKAACFDQRLLSSGHENRKRYSTQSHYLVPIIESS